MKRKTGPLPPLTERVMANVKLVSLIASRWKLKTLDADDVFQVGMIGLMNADRTYKDGKIKFSAWASICIQSAINDERRKEQRRAKITKFEELPSTLTSKELEPFVAIDVKDLVDATLVGFSAMQKTLILHRIEGIPQGETAKQINRSRSGVCLLQKKLFDVLSEKYELQV